MSKSRSKNYSKGSSRKSAKPNKSNGLKSLAYNMGLVERGRKNPNGSIVADSYNAGLNKSRKDKKPLY